MDLSVVQRQPRTFLKTGEKVRGSRNKEMCATGLNLPFDYFKVSIQGLDLVHGFPDRSKFKILGLARTSRTPDQVVRGSLIVRMILDDA